MPLLYCTFLAILLYSVNALKMHTDKKTRLHMLLHPLIKGCICSLVTDVMAKHVLGFVCLAVSWGMQHFFPSLPVVQLNCIDS